MRHHFKNTCIDKPSLLNNVNTLSKFIRVSRDQADAQAISHPGMWEPHVYFGDAFEALCEVLINGSKFDKRLNIVKYRPGNPNADMGIDGVGKTHDNLVHTVQMKARSNTQGFLTANKDHLSNFVANSVMKYGDKLGMMTIMTSAKGLHHKTLNEMYSGNKKIHVLGYDELRKLIDNNAPFWAQFTKEMGK